MREYAGNSEEYGSMQPMQRVFHPLRSRKATPIRAADLATPHTSLRSFYADAVSEIFRDGRPFRSISIVWAYIGFRHRTHKRGRLYPVEKGFS